MACIFCKIIAGEIPAHKVYQDDAVVAFLDISQTTKGHTLIVPRRHVKTVYDLSAKEASQIFGVVPELANALRRAFSPIGLNVLNNNERPLQSVDHVHVHLIPRYEDDRLKIGMPDHHDALRTQDYEDIKQKILDALS